MKSKSNNPFIRFCVENYWIASYILLLGLFLNGVFISQIAKIAYYTLILLAVIFSIVGLVFGRRRSKVEQKAEYDERTQMINQKAAEWSSTVTIGTCYIIAWVCLLLDYLDIGLLFFSIAFFNQLLMLILKKVFSNKY